MKSIIFAHFLQVINALLKSRCFAAEFSRASMINPGIRYIIDYLSSSSCVLLTSSFKNKQAIENTGSVLLNELRTSVDTPPTMEISFLWRCDLLISSAADVAHQTIDLIDIHFKSIVHTVKFIFCIKDTMVELLNDLNQPNATINDKLASISLHFLMLQYLKKLATSPNTDKLLLKSYNQDLVVNILNAATDNHFIAEVRDIKNSLRPDSSSTPSARL